MVYQQELAATESSSPKPVWGKLPAIEVKPIPKQTEIHKESKSPMAPADRKGKKV